MIPLTSPIPVKLKTRVLFRDGGAVGDINIDLPPGATGAVIQMADDLNRVIIVKFDQPFACLDGYDNSATFDLDTDGCQGVAVASEVFEELPQELR